jgi:Na+/H+ antiporter NhaC
MESLEPVRGAPLRWQNAFFPVLTVILLTIFGLLQTGMEATLDSLLAEGIQTNGTGWGAVWAGMAEQNPAGSFFTRLGAVIGNADSYIALLWASASGVILAVILTVSQRIIRLFDTMHHLVTGFKTMLPALIILTLAWALAITTVELHTATYITTALEGNVSPLLLPMIVFVLAAFIAFSTGSSWSTMAILYPIAIPTTWAVSLAAGFDPQMSLEILLNVIATVLAASVLGDHCSPISDTTILSSLASDCNHIDHVRTQLPYAVTVGLVALGCCGLSTFLGGGWLVSFVLLLFGLAVLYLVILRIGKPLPMDE